MIHFAIVREDGTLAGGGTKICASSNEAKFENYPVPKGYKKVMLTIEEYDALTLDFDVENLVHNCKVDVNAAEDAPKILQLSVEEKQAIINKRPEWYRDTLEKDGRIKREKKDGTVWEVNPDAGLTPWVMEE